MNTIQDVYNYFIDKFISKGLLVSRDNNDFEDDLSEVVVKILSNGAMDATVTENSNIVLLEEQVAGARSVFWELVESLNKRDLFEEGVDEVDEIDMRVLPNGAIDAKFKDRLYLFENGYWEEQ